MCPTYDHIKKIYYPIPIEREECLSLTFGITGKPKVTRASLTALACSSIGPPSLNSSFACGGTAFISLCFTYPSRHNKEEGVWIQYAGEGRCCYLYSTNMGLVVCFSPPFECFERLMALFNTLERSGQRYLYRKVPSSNHASLSSDPQHCLLLALTLILTKGGTERPRAETNLLRHLNPRTHNQWITDSTHIIEPVYLRFRRS